MTIQSSTSSSNSEHAQNNPPHSSNQFSREEDSLQSSIWCHDTELGRGFLLVAAHNRLWRWERGGGPIPIGRTLQMDHAGCRPEHEYCQNNIGNNQYVGGMAVDFMDSVGTKEPMAFLTGQLILTEWGEGRIVRLEDNGARTPLALLTSKNNPHSSSTPTTRTNPGTEARHLLMTPFGDLLFEKDHTIQMIAQAMTIQPLESLAESRLAHNHTWIHRHRSIPHTHVFWKIPSAPTGTVNGMALSDSWNLLYASVTTAPNGHAQLFRISLADEHDSDDDDDDDKEDDTPDDDETSDKIGAGTNKPPTSPDSELVFDLTATLPSLTHAGPIAVTQSGVVYWVVNHVNLVILQPEDKGDGSSSSFSIMGYLTMPETITSLTVGGTEDSHLYLTTLQRVWKWPTKIPTHPVNVPTNLAPTHRAKEPLSAAASE